MQFRKTLFVLIDFNDLMYIWGHLGVTLGAHFPKRIEDNGRKVKNGPQKRHIDVEWHLYCISYRLVSDPNGPISRIYSFLQHILLVQAGPEASKAANSPAGNGGGKG